jgi:hypothetical protein
VGPHERASELGRSLRPASSPSNAARLCALRLARSEMLFLSGRVSRRRRRRTGASRWQGLRKRLGLTVSPPEMRILAAPLPRARGRPRRGETLKPFCRCHRDREPPALSLLARARRSRATRSRAESPRPRAFILPARARGSGEGQGEGERSEGGRTLREDSHGRGESPHSARLPRYPFRSFARRRP